MARGDGFEKVLVALDASTDAEYPVVESAGRWRGGVGGVRGGHCDGDVTASSPSSRVTHAGGHRQQSPAGRLPPEPPASPGTPGREGEGWGGSTLTHPKKLFSHPKIHVSLSPSWPRRGRLGTAAPSSPSCSSSRHGPPCTRSAGAGGHAQGAGSHQRPPRLCVTLRGRAGVALSPRCHLPQAHHLFELLKLQRIFVTRFGELVGAVSRAEVRGGGEGGTSG